MSVLIRRPRTVAKIRRLVKRTGETITDAVERAIDQRLAELGPANQKKGSVDRKKLAQLLAYFDSLPRRNEDLTDDEIIGYDENGLPK